MALRIGTFNLENFDLADEEGPTLEDRIAVLRPQLRRLRADVLCLQEVHAQESSDGSRALSALDRLLEDTRYASYNRVHTQTEDGEPYRWRNLVILSRLPITGSDQYNNDLVEPPRYRPVTADPAPEGADDVRVGRPLLHAVLGQEGGPPLHLINLHLRSRRPTDIEGQQAAGRDYQWLSAAGWAEGYFVSSMKRVSQALETRVLVDQVFDQDEKARIAVCGDLNAHPDEVPVEAIAGRVENTSNPDLVERVLVPCEHTIPDSARYTYLYHGQKRLLDHMLISRPLTSSYATSEIHNELLHDESLKYAFDTKFPESDHAPFVAEFTGEPL